MSTKDKRLLKILNNPKNVKFLDLNSLLIELGYIRRQSGKGSSHYVYSHTDSNILVVLVSHSKNDLLPEYQVKKALLSIKSLEKN